MLTQQNIIKKYTCYFVVFLFSVFFYSMLPACNTVSRMPNSTSNSSNKTTSKMNEQVRKFLQEHNLSLEDKPGWTPSGILDYSDHADETFQNKLHDSMHGYITSISKNKIGVNEIIWISNTNEDSGFKILDEYPDIIQYSLPEDVEVWILTEMVHIQIPLQDLKSYVKEYKDTLWCIRVKEGRVRTIIERYVP